MNPKIKDEPYLMLPYGNLCIPMSLAGDVIKHSLFVDRNYNSEIKDYNYTACEKGQLDTTVVDSDVLKAALVAKKLEKA